ncbi:MAG: SRPBCC domain-containing protein [Ignavibacteriales bacterium]|nr:SRPBCC domain-containing protein [Ignavibacteriales bacterium]
MKQKNISKDRVLEMTEVFNTTPERLFKAWTNEKDFAAWYGPEGFEVTYCKLDVRVGGHWRAGISTGDGEEYWMEGKYIEIIEGEKLVFTFNDGSENKNPDLDTIVIITFSKSGNQTIMNFNQSVFPAVRDRDSHYGGWASAFECLREHVEN